jgi:hypothetical protein
MIELEKLEAELPKTWVNHLLIIKGLPVTLVRNYFGRTYR